MEFRRTIQAVALGLALCLPAMMVRVGLLGADPEPAPPATGSEAVGKPPIAAGSRISDMPAGTASSGTADPRGQLLAMESTSAPVDAHPDGPIVFGDGSAVRGDARSGAPITVADSAAAGGNAFASASGGSQPAGPSASASRGAAGAAFGSGTGASSANAARNATQPASADDTATDVAQTDAAPHDEAHRRGVRSLGGSGASATFSAAKSSTTPSSPPVENVGSTMGTLDTDGSFGGDRPAQAGTVPFVFDAASDTLDVSATDEHHDPTIRPADFVPTDPALKELAAIDAQPAAAIPEPGIVTLFFLGLSMLSLARHVPAKTVRALRRRAPGCRAG